MAGQSSAAHSDNSQPAFGSILKEWHNQRRMSQLDLGLSANVSPRHISFLETGRSQPSRSMVLQLCDELDIPRQTRNHLLTAAGFAPAYGERDLTDADMGPALSAMEWMLDRHDPFPALAMDRHWCIVRMNRMSARLMAGFGLSEGDSVLTALWDNPALQQALENIEEVSAHTVLRLRTESAHLGGDPVLDAAAARLAGAFPAPAHLQTGLLPAFIPARYRANGMAFSFFSTFTQFGSAEDIALSELKIEMMFPADDATRQALLAVEDQTAG